MDKDKMSELELRLMQSRFMQFERMSDLARDLVVSPYIVKGLLYADSLTHIFGPSETCKSLIATTMCMHIANGRQWMGRAVKPADVFLIVGEGKNGVVRRCAAMSERWGLAMENVFISHSGINGCSEAEVIGLRQGIEAVRSDNELMVIIIDTVARNFGGNENDSKDMGAFINNIDRFLRQHFGAAVVLVHHSGVGDQSRGRGSSALRGAVDMEYIVSKDDSLVQMKCTKSKDWERPDQLQFRVVSAPVSHVLDEDGDPITAACLDVYSPNTGENEMDTQLQNDIAFIRYLIGKQRQLQFENLRESGIEAAHILVASKDIRDQFWSHLDGIGVYNKTVKRKRWARAKASDSFAVFNDHMYVK